MSRLIPFPDVIGSMEDADVLDLAVTVEQPERGERGLGVVRASVRYATSARVSKIVDFYLDELNVVGLRAKRPTNIATDRRNVFQVQLDDDRSTSLRISIDSFPGYRAVRVSAHYDNFDHTEIFDRFATWHDGVAPIDESARPTGVEIRTFAAGRRPSTMVLYTTHYASETTPWQAARNMVDMRLQELGWSYREPRQGAMFIQDGLYEAETHVLGDDSSSSVSHVGEFQLR